MKKYTLALAIFASLFFLTPTSADAKRTVPQARSTASTGKVVSASKGVTTSVKFRSDRRAIVATFSNLSVASNVTYSLSYDSKGMTQGAGGSLKGDAGDPTTRELLFGTCSSGVCRYDSGITNAKLVITTTLKTGKKVVRTYRLKV